MELLSISFNQDFTCFACGTKRGFIIFNCNPLKARFQRDLGGSFHIVEMLDKTNIVGLVGGGTAPKYPPNKMVIWDDYQGKNIAELEFKNVIKGVKLRRQNIIVILEFKVFIYNFTDLTLLGSFPTYANPFGLAALSPKEQILLAIPAERSGSVRVITDPSGKSEDKLIVAHENPLRFLALNSDGKLLATASAKGTVIRVFNTATCNKLHEFRRGLDPADITYLNFDPLSTHLVLNSSKNTVHVFSFDSYRSIAKCHTNSLVAAFTGEPYLILLIGKDGTTHRYKFFPTETDKLTLDASLVLSNN